tara:strand:- start:143 stop:733 length:591 start_codon:yes stop_codon:yes gene_type:complete
MKSPFYFIIEPKGARYNNTKEVGNKELILNTDISKHEFINRQGIVKSIPLAYKTEIQVGDTVIVNHNIFRRWYDVKGREKNSRSFINETTYVVQQDQVYAYKRLDKWKPLEGYCFVKPLKNDWKYSLNPEKPLTGMVKYSSNYLKEGDVIGFCPNDEYEFVVDGERLYRIMNKFITMKYEYQRNQETYNTSWAQGS